MLQRLASLQQVEFASKAQIHLVFHISQLKRHIGSKVQLHSQPHQATMEQNLESEVILDRRVVPQRKIVLAKVLVQRKFTPVAEPTSERYWDLVKRIHALDL